MMDVYREKFLFLSSLWGATLVIPAKAGIQEDLQSTCPRGALINSIFMDHFQNMARGHFIMRGLGNKYGPEEVSRLYNCGS